MTITSYTKGSSEGAECRAQFFSVRRRTSGMSRTNNDPSVRKRIIAWHVVLCLFLLIIHTGCSEKPGGAQPATPPPANTGLGVSGSPAQPSSSSQPRPPWELDTTPNAARVYVDLSGSMQGYQRGPESPLQSLGRELKASLVAGGVSQFDAVGFGTSLDQPVDGATLLEALAWQANRPDTCLKLPIAEELRIFESSGHQTRRVTLVVTDGVASANTVGACGKECSTTSDQTCLASSIRDYIHAGFAFFVLGVRVPFRGTFYPAEGGAITVEPAVQRPIYIWIGSPSAQLGRQVVADLLAWARGRGLQSIALDVWPGVWTGPELDSVSSSAALAPPQGTIDVCAKRNNVVVDALPTGRPPMIRLRSIGSSGQHVWAARLPLVKPGVGNQASVLPLFSTSAAVNLDQGSVQWNADANVPAALACLSWTGSSASLRLEWSTSPSTVWQQPLGEWSEPFGKGVATDPSRTEGLQDLWALTARLFPSDRPRIVSSMLDIAVK
jgi:hypothetical protein